MRALFQIRAGRIAIYATIFLISATMIGLVALWPRGESLIPKRSNNVEQKEIKAEVTSVKKVPCSTAELTGCRIVEAEILEGEQRGQVAVFDDVAVGPNAGAEVGNRVFVVKNEVATQQQEYNIKPYSLAGYDRQQPLILLTVIFLAVVLVMGRWRGFRSLIGLACSLLIVATFMVPAILHGTPPLAVAIVGSTAIMIVTIVLAHGLGVQSIAAMLGTSISLAITVFLAVIFTDLAHIIGSSSEESSLLLAGQTEISLQGLILAGIVIGALGVLDDVTVSQASTVMALRKADPHQGFRVLYARALEVGRDHVSATVNTLVLAYVGASLPLVLIFTVGDTGFFEATNLEQVASQIVATLVGSIGLISAVPATTALASVLAAHLPSSAIGDGGHTHSH